MKYNLTSGGAKSGELKWVSKRHRPLAYVQCNECHHNTKTSDQFVSTKNNCNKFAQLKSCIYICNPKVAQLNIKK
ncbi:hypothetical protein SAMN05428975_5161 [Mucilaginibacter sp. OK268]|nr:hypothetical protein SAMN05428975_5161 [Mucilaginibacter sp. OK268]